MKEATGELNMTLIVVVSIGILAAFFFGFLWPMLNHNFQKESQCKNATCDCSRATENDYRCECWMKSEDEEHFYCPFGG